MDITFQNNVTRAVFTNGVTASTVDLHGITLELDSNNSIVAATYTCHGAAVRLIRILNRDYGLVLSQQDQNTLLSK